MDPRETPNDAPESLNREQQDADQAQDVADDARRPASGHDSVRGPADRTQILPDDRPDLVETMNAMVRSGHIDNGAYAGEPQHDDEEDQLGDTEADGDGDDALYNTGADGSEDPLAVPVDLDDVADTGDDPLGAVASEHGLEDEDSDDDDDDDDYDDADDDDLDEVEDEAER